MLPSAQKVHMPEYGHCIMCLVTHRAHVPSLSLGAADSSGSVKFDMRSLCAAVSSRAALALVCGIDSDLTLCDVTSHKRQKTNPSCKMNWCKQ